jgi:CheY-like chemotaxis protein
MRHFLHDVIADQYPDMQIMEAWDGLEAIELAKTTPPNLILLDLRLPFMSGYQVTALLRQVAEIRNVPIVLMSGGEIDAQMPMNSAYVSTLQKPFAPEKLYKMIDQLVLAR